MIRIKYIIGIDEAGRGPLAGPVAVAAAAIKLQRNLQFPILNFQSISNVKIFNNQNFNFLRGIKDSKKLSERQREEWYEKICLHLPEPNLSVSRAEPWDPKKVRREHLRFGSGCGNLKIASAMISHKFIDEKGIAPAIQKGVNDVLKKLAKENGINAKNCLVLLDGSLHAPKEYQQETIIKGDEKIPLISAASIVAKVRRDRLMKRFHKKFPEYCFAVHNGYGTKSHIAKIKEFGLCEIHRRSFCRNFV